MDLNNFTDWESSQKMKRWWLPVLSNYRVSTKVQFIICGWATGEVSMYKYVCVMERKRILKAPSKQRIPRPDNIFIQCFNPSCKAWGIQSYIARSGINSVLYSAQCSWMQFQVDSICVILWRTCSSSLILRWNSSHL